MVILTIAASHYPCKCFPFQCAQRRQPCGTSRNFLISSRWQFIFPSALIQPSCWVRDILATALLPLVGLFLPINSSQKRIQRCFGFFESLSGVSFSNLSRIRSPKRVKIAIFGFGYGFGFGLDWIGFRRQSAAIRRRLRQNVIGIFRSWIFGFDISDSLMLTPSWEPKVGLPAYCVEGNAAFGRQTVDSGIYVL